MSKIVLDWHFCMHIDDIYLLQARYVLLVKCEKKIKQIKEKD